MRRLLGFFAATTLAALPFFTACIHKSDNGPCDGKAEGATCRLCASDDPGCVETMEVKTCSASGVCGAHADAGKVDRRNDGFPWVIDEGGGFCLSWMGVGDAPDGGQWVGTGSGLYALDTRDPDLPFPFVRPTLSGGAVRAMTTLGDRTFVAFADPVVVEYLRGGGKAPLERGSSTPLALSDDGCLGARVDDKLMVRAPGEAAPREAPLPRPPNGFRVEVAAAVGLSNALLVRTYRGKDGVIGSLARVSCPGLEVTEVATGGSLSTLVSLQRDARGRLWGIDRVSSGATDQTWRVVRSADEGKTWAPAPLPEGFQASKYALRGDWVVAAAPKLEAIAISKDGGESFTVEPITTYSSVKGMDTFSVYVSSDGLVAIGGNCNYLVHRRAKLTR
ncbi:MAG: hypothetical protein JNL38_19665 [Myxococcales bacterium]|jgi:hypothetical protein|nr:hypothetical protein [Myxococcales bacterium]